MTADKINKIGVLLVRKTVGLVAALSACILVPAPSSAVPSHVPAVFRYVSVAVVQGDVITSTCESNLPEIAFLAQAHTEGDVMTQGSFDLTSNLDDIFVDARLGPQGFSQTLDEGPDDSGWTGFGLGMEVHSTGRYRAVWASWGGDPITCSLRKNGVALNAENGSPTKGTYLLASDFTGGVGVSSLVGAAPALTLEQEVQGFVFTFMPIRGQS